MEANLIRRLWRALPVRLRERLWANATLNGELASRLTGSSAFGLAQDLGQGLIQLRVIDPIRRPNYLTLVVPKNNMFLVTDVFAKRYCVHFFHEINRHFQLRHYSNPLILDAGANIGVFSKLASATFRRYGARVLAFEPLPQNLTLLRTNLAGFESSIEIIGCALGAQAEEGRRMIVLSATGATIQEDEAWAYLRSKGRPLDAPEVKVDVTTIDAYVKPGTGQVALIKMDVEGSEESILKGAAATIARDRPAIIYSYEHMINDRAYAEGFVKSLADYRSVDHSPTKSLLFVPN